MARIQDAPGSLRELAARVPEGTRKALPKGELVARCMYASRLYAEAGLQEAEAAENTRLKASRVLASLPISDGCGSSEVMQCEAF